MTSFAASAFFVMTELVRAKKFLSAVKKIKRIMESLCTDATAEIATLTKHIMPAVLYHGLDDIPDEMLSRILTLDALGSPVATRPEELRLVNKRFQGVVSSTVECWSQVKEGTSRRRIFNNAPVRLTITQSTTVEDVDFYKERILHLKINDLTPMHEVMSRELPSVRSLSYSCSFYALQNWTFPQLTRLECQSIPPPGTFPLLTHCALDLEVSYYVENIDDGPIADNVPDYDQLIKFLGSTPLLRSLSFPYDIHTHYLINGPALLPNLKYLHVRTDGLDGVLLAIVDCPKLEVMEITFDSFYEYEHGELISDFSNFELPNVKTLIVQGKHGRTEVLEIRAMNIHRTFPALQRLVIDGIFQITDSRLWREDYEGVSTAFLTSVLFCIPLLIIKEAQDNWSSLSSLLGWYREKGVQLESLEVIDKGRDVSRKSQVSFKELTTLFPSTKIRVNDVKRMFH